MFELTFPEAEAEHLKAAYRQARVILEYGSGGSTRFAAELPGKFIQSVESDRDWAVSLQAGLDAANLPSAAVVYHVDIGPTGRWGRPVDAAAWQNFHRYPLAIWKEAFFRHPDLVLIDGRFRASCLATVCLNATRPVRVLFDDYTDRPSYHVVERFAPLVTTVGRMAEFCIEPDAVPADMWDEVIGLLSQATYSGGPPPDYGPEPAGNSARKGNGA